MNWIKLLRPTSHKNRSFQNVLVIPRQSEQKKIYTNVAMNIWKPEARFGRLVHPPDRKTGRAYSYNPGSVIGPTDRKLLSSVTKMVKNYASASYIAVMKLSVPSACNK